MAKKEQTKVRVNVLFEPEEHERLKTYCEREGYKQSTLIARIVREYLADKVAKAARPRSKSRAKPRASAKSTRSGR